jgi:hypothetical protein
MFALYRHAVTMVDVGVGGDVGVGCAAGTEGRIASDARGLWLGAWAFTDLFPLTQRNARATVAR